MSTDKRVGVSYGRDRSGRTPSPSMSCEKPVWRTMKRLFWPVYVSFSAETRSERKSTTAARRKHRTSARSNISTRQTGRQGRRRRRTRRRLRRSRKPREGRTSLTSLISRPWFCSTIPMDLPTSSSRSTSRTRNRNSRVWKASCWYCSWSRGWSACTSSSF